MGDQTPEPIEIQCPGCQRRFRLTPKKGRLPTGGIPCPRCGEEIPESVIQGAASSDGDADAIDRLAKMATDLPANSTMAGLPGVGRSNNPFTRDSQRDKTARVDPDILKGVGEDHEAIEQPSKEEDNSTSPWDDEHREETSPRLVNEQTIERLANESSSAAISPDDLPKEEDTPIGLRTSSQQSVPDGNDQPKTVQHLRDTTENPALSNEDVEADKQQHSSSNTIQGPASDLLKRIKERKSSRADSSRSSLEETTSQGNQKDSDAKSATRPPLAKLFKKVRKRRGTDSGSVRQRLSSRPGEPIPTSAQGDQTSEINLDEAVGLSDDEVADLIDAEEEDVDSTESTDNHDALFDDVQEEPASFDEASTEIDSVSQKPGRTTTHSMLARLKRRRHEKKATSGDASELKGSGIIRLRADDIQNLLGKGNYRLRIEGVVYEPIDEEGIEKLIDDEILVGGEDIAEGSGGWGPLSEHSIFEDAQEKEASQAGQILSPLDTDSSEEETEEETSEDDGPPSLPIPKPATDTTDTPGLPKPERDKSPSSSKSTQQLYTPSDADIEAFQSEEATDDEDHGGEKVEPPPAGAEGEHTDAPPAVEESEPESSEPSKESETPEESREPTSTSDDQEQRPTPPSAQKESAEKDGQNVYDYDDYAKSDPEDELDTGFDKSGLLDAETTLADSQRRRESKLPIIVGVAIGSIILVAGGLMLTEPGQDFFDGLGTSEAPKSDPEPTPGVDPEVMSEAIEEAKYRVRAALPPDGFSQTVETDQWLSDRLDAGDLEGAADVMRAQWQDGRRDSDFGIQFSETLRELGDYTRARRVALDALGESPESDALIAALHDAVIADDSLTSYDWTILDEPRAQDLEPLASYDQRGQVGVVFQDPNFDQQVVFKPEHPQQPGHWSYEVASWRVCELIQCNLQLPKTAPAIMTEEFADALTWPSGSDGWIERAGWRTIDIDGEEVRALYGSWSLKAPPEATPFPVEGPTRWIRQWRQWLTSSESQALLEEPLSENLDALDVLGDGSVAEALRAETAQMTVGDAARQISSLVVYDFLINYFERFASDQASFGTNTPLLDGKMWALHHGDAFQLRDSRRVQGRFEWTSRFSRTTVRTLAALDRELASRVLFPEATAAQERRLERFWTQRQAILDRVDQLQDRHGEDAVLYFP